MSEQSASTWRSLLASSVAAWLFYLAADFLLHAVFFSPWWRTTEEYWLPPLQLFQFIPFGYASFALYCGALSWLIWRLFGPKPSVSRGLSFGAGAGLFFGVTGILANFSVFRLPTSALLVWPLSAVITSASAGMAAAWVMRASHPWRRTAATLGIAIGLILVGIVIQNLFFPGTAAP
jgi:hypothetical protein